MLLLLQLQLQHDVDCRMTAEMIPRHEAWRRQYRAKRYCLHLSQDELNRRIRTVIINMLLLTDDVKIGVLQIEFEGSRWIELWAHVLEEMCLRHGPYPNGFTREILHSDTEPFPNFVGELGRKAAAVLSGKGLKSGKFFIKFGKADHMQSLYERGAMRVQSASYYATPNHNGAVRDDELSLPISLALTREDIIKIVKNPQDVPIRQIDHRFDIKYQSETDYWLYCVTTSVEPRLFVDFGANSCVIIKDQDHFQRLLALQSAVAFPNTAHRHGKAIYVDPQLPTTAVIDVPMSKHFGYTYQDEYRFVWRPNTPLSNLPFVDLELGSLKDFAELVVL